MSQPLRLVEEQTGEKVLRLEVWHNALNYEVRTAPLRRHIPWTVDTKGSFEACGAL